MTLTTYRGYGGAEGTFGPQVSVNLLDIGANGRRNGSAQPDLRRVGRVVGHAAEDGDGHRLAGADDQRVLRRVVGRVDRRAGGGIVIALAGPGLLANFGKCVALRVGG